MLMYANEKLLELRFPAKADRLRLMRRVILDAVELATSNHATAENAVIAVNEACMNIIQHAYGESGEGDIILEIINNGKELVFQLTDFALPADVEKIKPRDLKDVRPGGLGTHFINEVMDSVEYTVHGQNEGNKLTMTLKID